MLYFYDEIQIKGDTVQTARMDSWKTAKWINMIAVKTQRGSMVDTNVASVHTSPTTYKIYGVTANTQDTEHHPIMV